MTKAEMEAFKKKNFDLTKKVTEAQLNKLRKEGTPAQAIAKYKNDPSMREALNRFYGKKRVGEVVADPKRPSSGLGAVRGGPGAKMPKPPRGGPGSKTRRDGRVPASKKTVTMGSRTGGTITVNKAANDKRKADFEKRTNRAMTVAGAIPVVRGAMLTKTGVSAAAKMSPMVTKTASRVVKSKTASKATSAATKVGNKVSTRTKAAEKMVIRKAQAVKKLKESSKSKTGKHSGKSKSNTTKTPSGIKSLPEPYTPDLTKFPKMDEAKLRRILGK